MADSVEEVGRWLAAARAGSQEALSQAFHACRDYLLLIANQELDPGLQAKGSPSDLVQETFLEAHRDFARFQGITAEELLAWLRRLLLHNIADFTRRYRDTAKRETARELPLEAGVSPGNHGLHPPGTPLEEAIANEQAELFRRALERLPDDYRRVILLRYQEQHSFEKIGQLMNRTSNAARMLWLRAIERLKQDWGTSS